jgi:hypothetical protein
MTKKQPSRLIERSDLAGDEAKLAALLRGVDAPKVSSSARARVWRRLQRPERARRPFLAAAIGGAAIAAVLVLFVRTLEREPIEVIAGRVAVEELKGGTHRIRAAQRAIIHHETVALDLSPHTELIAASGDQVAIELLAGGIVAAPLRGTAPRLAITAGDYRIEGDGIRARVVRADGGEITIEVLAGKAELVGPSTQRALRQGETFSSARSVEARAHDPSLERAPLETVARVAKDEASTDPSRTDAAGRKTERSKRRRAVRRDAARERAHRAGTHAEHRDSSDAVREADVERREADPSVRRVAGDEAEAREAVREASEIVPREIPAREPARIEETPAIPGPTDWAALYREARSERDPARALPMFERIARSESAFAEVSAFQAARIEMRAGRCEPAIDRFKPLIGGTFDVEARLDVIECQLALGDLVAAQRSLENFLAVHPNNERHADLRFLRAELMRKRDRCGEAIGDYESAETSRHADDALYFGAWCKLQSGRTEDGVAALRRYLERFPAGRHAAEARKKL